MIKPICDKCKKELKKNGALLFSPPSDGSNMVIKWHLCKKCYYLVENFINPYAKK